MDTDTGFFKTRPAYNHAPCLPPPLFLARREEVMTLQALRHPNVLQFLGACMMPPNLIMVTEHMPHSLHAVLYTMQVWGCRGRG